MNLYLYVWMIIKLYYLPSDIVNVVLVIDFCCCFKVLWVIFRWLIGSKSDQIVTQRPSVDWSHDEVVNWALDLCPVTTDSLMNFIDNHKIGLYAYSKEIIDNIRYNVIKL